MPSPGSNLHASPKSPPLAEWLWRVGVVVLFTAAVLLLLVYGVLALNWQARPFLGVILSPRLYVDNIAKISNERWPGEEAGLRPGDRIFALNNVMLDPDYRVALGQMEGILAEAQVGEIVAVTISRPVDSFPPAGRLSCSAMSGDMPAVEGMLFCVASFSLAQFPLVDLVALFGVGWIVGVALLVTAGVMLRLRWRDPNVRRVALFSVVMAVAMAGAFDALYTTFALTPVFLGALIVAGGVMFDLALHFPVDLKVIQRRPGLRWLPLLFTGAGLVALAALIPLSSRDQFWPSWLFTILFVVPMAGVLLVSLVMRLRNTASPQVRDQAAIALVSLVISLLPFVLWVVSDQLQDIIRSAAFGFQFGLVSPFMLFVPLGLFFALSQRRLPDGDTVLSQGTVYGLMALAVASGYGLIVTGVSLLGGALLPENNPLLLGMTVFIMALLFVPLRSALERRINQVYFRTHRLYQRRVENLAQALTRLSSLRGIAEAVTAQLNETLLPTHVFLFFLDQESSQYKAHGADRPETDVRFAVDSPLLDMLAQQHRPLNLDEHEHLMPELLSERSRLAVLRATVLVPLIGQDQLSGMMAVGPRRSGQRYQYEDLSFMQNLADQAALAVERAQVIGNLQQRVNELNVLGQVAQAVNYTIEFDDLLELIYAQTNRVITAPNFYIALRDPNTDELFFAFYTEADERLTQFEGRRWRMGRDLLSDIVRTGQPMRIEDYGVEMQRRGGQTPLENPDLRAWMGVPLNAPGYTLGTMCVGSTDTALAYSDEQLKILWQIADQAATAIDKSRLFQETQVRARQLTALNEISTQLATVFQDTDQLLDLITQSAVSILNAEAGSLLMIDPASGELEFKVVVGEGGHDLLGTRLPGGTGLVGTVADRGEPVIVNDTTRDPRWFSGVDDDIEFRTHTLMAVPLVASSGVIGVLEVINKTDGGVFVEDDKRLLTTFAGQGAIAIENARLFQLTDQQLAARVDELDTMQKIDRELNETLDPTRVMDITLDWAMRESGATAGALATISGEPPMLRIMTHRGYPPDTMPEEQGTVWPLERGIVGRVARTGQSELVTDVTIDSDYVPTLPNGQSQLTVPLITGGKVSGVIMLESDASNTFDLFTLDFVSRLAEHASPAMANANLFAQLEHANRSRSEFVSFVAHELKTPMTSIKGFTDLILKGVVGPVNDQQGNFLNTIRSNVDRMNTLVSDLNDVTKLQTDQMRLEKSPIDFKNVIIETLRPLQRQIEDKQQVLDLQVPDNLPPIFADQNRMIQVLTNLLSNAYKYTPPEGTITIFAESGRNVWDEDGQGPPEVMHFYVQDDGIGISEEDMESLFQPYFRTTNQEALDQPGTGLGLVIVRGIVVQHGGRIWVESEIGKGTTFHVTVPLASSLERRRAPTESVAAD